jgi:hypothetical protein
VLLDAGSIPAVSTNKNATPGWLFYWCCLLIEPAGRGAQAGFRRACLPLPKRSRACKREDREIPAVSINKKPPRGGFLLVLPDKHLPAAQWTGSTVYPSIAAPSPLFVIPFHFSRSLTRSRPTCFHTALLIIDKKQKQLFPSASV